MRKPASEITNLKAWVKNKKKGEGRAEWAIEYFIKRGYGDYPEIADPLERLLQVVGSEINYPRFAPAIKAMKQAWRTMDAAKKRSAALVPLRIDVTGQQKQLLVEMAKANRESRSKTVGRLIDEAGQAQEKAEQRVAGRYKSRLQAQKAKYELLEKTVTQNNSLALMRGRLAGDLMALKKNHYQLEVMALQWLRELCNSLVMINDAGIRAPLLPEQLDEAEKMYSNHVESLRFLGKPPEPDLQLQELLDLGQMDFYNHQSMPPGQPSGKSKEKKVRKSHTPQESSEKPEAVDATHPASELVLPVESQVGIVALSGSDDEVMQEKP